MIIEEIKAVKCGQKENRSFTFIMGIMLFFIGSLIWWRGKTWYEYLLYCSIVFFVLYIIKPGFVKYLYICWMSLGICIGWIISRLILLIVFYGVLTPISLGGRLYGKKFLNRAIERDTETYWIKREESTNDSKTCENQF